MESLVFPLCFHELADLGTDLILSSQLSRSSDSQFQSSGDDHQAGKTNRISGRDPSASDDSISVPMKSPQSASVIGSYLTRASATAVSVLSKTTSLRRMTSLGTPQSGGSIKPLQPRIKVMHWCAQTEVSLAIEPLM